MKTPHVTGGSPTNRRVAPPRTLSRLERESSSGETPRAAIATASTESRPSPLEFVVSPKSMSAPPSLSPPRASFSLISLIRRTMFLSPNKRSSTPTLAASRSSGRKTTSSPSRRHHADWSTLSKGLPPKSPRHGNNPTLVLDVDETLVSTKVFNAAEYVMMRFEREEGQPAWFSFISGNEAFHVTLRPGLREFLEWAHERFEIVAFTAGEAEYAHPLLDTIDPDNKYFAHRLTRAHCTRVGRRFTKDLTKLNRDLARVVLVDNAPHSFLMHPHNGVPIMDFNGENHADDALLVLRDFLESILHEPDLRAVLRPTFELESEIQKFVSADGEVIA